VNKTTSLYYTVCRPPRSLPILSY